MDLDRVKGKFLYKSKGTLKFVKNTYIGGLQLPKIIETMSLAIRNKCPLSNGNFVGFQVTTKILLNLPNLEFCKAKPV